MATRDRSRRAHQGQLDLGEAFLPATPAVTDTDDDTLQTRLADLARGAEHRFATPDAHNWANSPYGWVKRLATVSRGKAATHLLTALLTDTGLPVTGRVDPDHDVLIHGRRARIKLSTLWAAGEYKFQQIRPGSYDLLLLLGLSPDRAHLWCVPKQLALTNLEPASDTCWLAFPPNRPPAWLDNFGGTIDAAVQALRHQVGDGPSATGPTESPADDTPSP